MELHQLRYFVAIVKAGSFTRAAEREGVAQPTLSQQIRRLENSLGAELLTRQGRAIRLTQAGAVFYPAAQEILNQSKRAVTQVRQLETDLRGPLRVGVIPTILPYLIAPNLPGFLRQYPELDVSLTEDLTERLVDQLQTGELDLIVASLPLHNRDLVCSAFLRDPLVLVTPPNHRLAEPFAKGVLATEGATRRSGETRSSAETLTLTQNSVISTGAKRSGETRFSAETLSPRRSTYPTFDLTTERLLLLKEGHCFRDDMLTACKHSRTETSPIFESNHFGTIFPLVASGAGITIAPAMAAAFATGCTILPLPKPQHRQVGYARLKSSATFKPLTAFTKWLRTLGKSTQ